MSPRPAAASDLRLNRREHLFAFLPAFAVFALLSEAGALTIAGSRRTMAPARWIDAHDEVARALAGGEITPLIWQAEVERLAREVDVAELMATVNRARLSPAPRGSHNDPAKRFVRFLDDTGEPRRLAYGAALFDFQPQNVITPHGHRHMVSAHLVVDGAFRVRNFDRIGDEDGAMVIRPTRDYVARTGDISTMSSQRDNIHWFVPHGRAPATTFDVVISDLDPGQPSYDIRAIDPLGGRARADGAIVAPIMSFRDSAARYTAEV
ncbi:MAG TPA: hypothetical protein VEA80_01950 [Vitreimonas sp.]|uniref:hypothetical protein n=1 Tax=Vitreimonas sp. TaxID=3069702 RepID=UPI002D714690|nr:hypothetical protein [Vitreimonas sp.]HYD86214.1 hypothetical protein [Vitreimonas sp.]